MDTKHESYNNEGKVTAIIVAGGTGSRMSLSVPKQYHKLRGKPLLSYAIESFEICDAVDEIILVVGQDGLAFCREEVVARHGFQKVAKIVPGGGDRQASVYNGLRAAEGASVALIHDGVRPFVTAAHIADVIQEARSTGGCLLAVRAKDTVKICTADMKVLDTPDRESLWLAQTPQGFRFDWLLSAHEAAARTHFTATDDAALMEHGGHTVTIVPGSYENIKITTDEDLLLCEWIMERRANNRNIC